MTSDIEPEMEPEKSPEELIKDLKIELNEDIAIGALRESRLRRSELSSEEKILKALYGDEAEEKLFESLAESDVDLEAMGRIRFEMSDGCTTEEFALFLLDFEKAYASIRFFLRRMSGNNQSLNDLLNFPEVNELPTIAKTRLGAVSFNSPGFWEAIASWNPLKVLCDYLGQRHERKKDKEYRNEQEREIAELEILAKRNEVISAQIETLKKAGFSDEEIKELLSKYISNSLENMGRKIDSGQVKAISVKREK